MGALDSPFGDKLALRREQRGALMFDTMPARFGAAVLIVALVFFGGGLNLARAAAATPVEDFVQQNVDKGYLLLKNKSLSDAERHAQFHAFMLSISDMRRIGMFTLGHYANGLSKADTDAYVATFTDYAIPVYEMWLSKYNDRTLKVTGAAQQAADDFVVKADVVSVTNPSAQVYKTTFRVRKGADGNFIIADMTAEGISLALTLRSDFTAYLQQHGDRVSDLVTRLKGQNQTMNSVGAAVGAGR
jgi:phospholipid transport system substrate-binding protein